MVLFTAITPWGGGWSSGCGDSIGMKDKVNDGSSNIYNSGNGSVGGGREGGGGGGEEGGGQDSNPCTW